MPIIGGATEQGEIMATQNIHLVIIDPQNDFCDLPASERPLIGGVQQAPALPVVGADADMQRVARLIRQGGAGLSKISITLDSHQRVDIAHPTFWRQGSGEAVAPFTQIRADDVSAGRYLPRQAEALPRVIAYLEALEANGRYVHMVWPVHCEIGSWGNNVHPAVLAACNRWEQRHVRNVAKVVKGVNPWTEHYSAIKAEVPDPQDADTELNQPLLDSLRQADELLVTGEAGSHCVKSTVEHMVENFTPAERQRLVLLSDCMSPVAGFETQYREFLEAMQALGVRCCTSQQWLQARP